MNDLPKAQAPFRFATQVNLTQVTTRKARNLPELLQHLKEVPLSVIYHHTHRFLKQHHFLSPEPPNDFAYWAYAGLQEERLAEKLASIDTIQYTLGTLRDKIVKTIEDHMGQNKHFRDALPGDEFYFMKSISFVLQTPYEASDLAEFASALKKVSIYSLYHHIFEARLRLPRGINDFSFWLESGLGERELAQKIARMDPYTQTLETLRKRIIRMVEKRVEELSYVAAR